MKTQILHVKAGDVSWNPTEAELQKIANKFRRAIRNSKTQWLPVVVTNAHVEATVIEVNDDITSVTTGRK